MTEELERIEGEYTYTYDQFTVFFYGDRIFIGGKDYPIGQCCVDIMNLDDAVLDEIDRRVKMFIPAARNLLTEKTDSAAALAQAKLNAVCFFYEQIAGCGDELFDSPIDFIQNCVVQIHDVHTALSNGIVLATYKNPVAIEEHCKLVVGICKFSVPQFPCHI